ncbi:GDSL-type esterase/lipase family protein [Lacibacter sp. MH-610]|uniref:GDSL-type esterase/lipase family protein n=1 Tax=Lacibacter sp. MH-610 TaxID=3020883 RepID=UPI00389268D0
MRNIILSFLLIFSFGSATSQNAHFKKELYQTNEIQPGKVTAGKFLNNKTGESGFHFKGFEILNNNKRIQESEMNTDANDVAPVTAYDGINSSGADYGSAQYMWALNTQNRSRVRQNGIISHVQLYMNHLPARLQSFWFFVWRKNGLTYDLIGKENIFLKLKGGIINYIKLDTPVAAQEGDFIGWGYEASSAGAAFLKSVPGIAGIRIQLTSEMPFNGYDWSAYPRLNSYLPIVCYMKAPDAVFIGNSIISGFNNHIAYISPFNSYDNPPSTIPFKVSALKKWTYQNMGIGGETSNEVAARFEKDVVQLKPCYAVIECGVNDLGAGYTAEQFISNYKTMLDLCRSNNIKPIVIRILPWTVGTNEQLQIRDTWNDQLSALALTYNAVVVNADTILGQFRPGGRSGNLWNLKPEFTDDGIHLTIAGNTALSNYLVDVLQSKNIEPSVRKQPLPLTVCSGSAAVFSINATGEALSYQWQYSADSAKTWRTINGAAANRLTIEKVSTLQNKYQYRCIVNGFCKTSDTSAAALLTVNPLPVVTLSTAPYTKLFPGLETTITASVVPAGGSIVWLRNGVPVSNTTNTITVNVDQVGSYKAVVTSVHGCVGESAVVAVLDSATSKLFFYPNPNQGQFQVRYNNPQSTGTQNYIRVFDARGTKVYEQLYSVSVPYTQMPVDLRARGSGIYLVELSDKNGKRVATGKVYIK